MAVTPKHVPIKLKVGKLQNYIQDLADPSEKIGIKPKTEDVFYNATSLNMPNSYPYYWSNTKQSWMPIAGLTAIPETLTSTPAANHPAKPYWDELIAMQDKIITKFGDAKAAYPKLIYLRVMDKQGNVKDIIPMNYAAWHYLKNADEPKGYSTDINTYNGRTSEYIDSPYFSNTYHPLGLFNLDTPLHEVYDVRDLTDPQSGISEWHPYQGWYHSQFVGEKRVPSLAWWLYTKDPNTIYSPELKDMATKTKAKYNAWGKTYYNKSSGLTEEEFAKILSDELAEKKDARLIDLARASFMPWYQNTWLPAQQSGDPVQIEAAANEELSPAVQDAEATMNTVASHEKGEERRGSQKLPYYLLGTVGVLSAIYIGYLVYKKKKGEK
jgi:hypothetical protein